MKRRRASSGSVIGLDLSLTSVGMVAIPIGWNQDMSKVAVATCGYKLTNEATLSNQYLRYLQIAYDVLDFCVNHRARHIWIEDHAYTAPGAQSARTKEMTGCVKTKLFEEHGLVAQTIQAAAARNVLLGRIPKQGKGKTKIYVLRNVRRLPWTTYWNDDQCDAFTVANYGIMKAGGMAMTFPGE